jgi:predicted dehydrogenase
LETWAHLEFTPAEGGVQRRLPLATGALTETQIWESFAAAVQGESSPAVDARSVLCTMALLDAARESSREGRAVDVSTVVDWVY